MYEEEARLPVHLWVEAQLAPLNARGIFYYIQQKGEQNSGIVLLKLNGLKGVCHLLIQQRNLDGEMGWMNVLGKDLVEEADADQYIQRATMRDPDLWVIEVEDQNMDNPFEGKMIS
ncbi:MAG: DUF1491 family protein [Alphaproteobacteria bacterium]